MTVEPLSEPSGDGSRTGSTIEIPSELSGLIKRHYSQVFFDESLSDLEAMLFSLYLAEANAKKAGAEYAVCKDIFVSLGRKENNFKANVYLAKKKLLLVADGEILEYTAQGLKLVEKTLGTEHKAPVILVRSGEAFTAIKHFEEFLSTEVKAKEVFLCDPFVSPSTLYPFSALAGRASVLKLLTSNLFDESKFVDYCQRMEKEFGIEVQVRINRHIHDRYLLASNRCWSIGASIKDLGNKDTVVKEITEVAESMNELFLKRWDEADGERGQE